MEELIEIFELTKIYDSRHAAVNNISIKIPRGKIIGLLGPNGSGKTTLIKMLAGVLTPTLGKITINGGPIGPESKAKIAYLPDRTYLSGGQKISDVLDYFSDFYKDFSKETAVSLLTKLGIDTDAMLKTLSKGNKEKVQLILVMSRKADLYVLDEPIAGVDPAARDYILNTIITNVNPGATVLISTHLINDIEQVLDEVIFMKYGSLVLYSTVDMIREKQNKSVDEYFREVFAC